MDKIDRWCVGILFVVAFIFIALIIIATANIDERLELLEAEPETVKMPPMSGPEDERQNEITEGFQEDAR